MDHPFDSPYDPARGRSSMVSRLLLLGSVLCFIGSCSETETVAIEEHEPEEVAVVRILAELVEIDRPFLIQLEYDADFNPTYSVRPLQGEWNGLKINGAEKWQQLDIAIDTDKASAAITKHGDFPRGGTDQLAMAESALIAAVNALAYEGRLTYPHVLSFNQVHDGWGFIFDRVPLVTGGFVTVFVSSDLSKVTVEPGL